MDLITPSFGLIFWQLVFFLLLVFVLGKFAWKPILASLREREQSIEDALELSRQTRAEMAELKASNDQILIEARIERDAIIRQAREAADGLIAQSKADAAEAGRKELDKARKAIQDEQAAVVAQMKKDVAILALNIAEKVLRKELADKKAQEALVSDLVADARMN
ncbi:MAG: F0F1 ATP synthase subunit B [Sphingobacteriaceae bacterium]|nr:F0F1 ATP synthase subunit B [Cytophagaceae bacterium]